METPSQSPLSWKTSIVFKTFLASAGFETLSFLSYYLPELRPAMLVLLGCAAAALALKDLRTVFGFLLVEMVIGGHGHLFAAGPVSIRMALFGVLAAGWLIHVMRGCSRLLHFAHANVSGPLLALVAAITLGVLRGWSAGVPAAAIFADANGYFFILLVPIALDLFADRASAAWLAKIFAGALAWLSAKSLLLLYFFSHVYGGFLLDLFRWQRKFWLSEVTPLPGGLVRVFSASDVFLLIGAFAGALMLVRARGWGTRLWTALCFAGLIVSLSRSFLMGAAVALTFSLPVLIRGRVLGPSGVESYFLRGTTAVVASLALVFAVAYAPLPKRSAEASEFGRFGARLLDAGDAAVTSRWNMLPPLQETIALSPVLGSGFGTAITYRSDDPRVISLHPGGIVTTSAIEWQYLEIWMKMGLFGLLAVLWLWVRIGRYFWRTLAQASKADKPLACALFQAFLAFALANVFTPYLNHPLGWMFLALVIAGLHAAQEHEKPPFEAAPRPF